ncbi:ABC transporter substrate-binding protein [Aquipuribacter sp. SD81]|uniref:ABC transporter substrate-binding protein n=1 Tax=Aquipuribacter sp. SD81 TaxID=3127703 RepID=UPI003017AD2B
MTLSLHRRAVLGAATTAAVLLAAGCGGSGDAVDEATDATGAAGDAATAAVDDATDAASDVATDAAGDDATAGGFPVTITHAFGETTIEEAPERVVTWGWGSTDAAIALGTVPVAIPLASYGGNEDGVLPWVAEALEAQGAETPTLIPDADGIPFEQVAAAQPDLILAVYSGITEEEYATLSEIAPVVAYPDQAWSTPWRDVVTTVGEALGRPDEAAQVLADIEAEVSAAAEANPVLEGTTVAAVYDTPDAFYVYEPADPRVEFLTDLGMEVAPSVSELSTGESTFFYTLSTELVGDLDSDVLLNYAESEEAAQAFLDQPYAASMEQVQQGSVAQVVGQDNVSSVSPPTALSLTYSLDTFVTELVEAAEAAQSGR